jgi:hypothetical protein
VAGDAPAVAVAARSRLDPAGDIGSVVGLGQRETPGVVERRDPAVHVRDLLVGAAFAHQRAEHAGLTRIQDRDGQIEAGELQPAESEIERPKLSGIVEQGGVILHPQGRQPGAQVRRRFGTFPPLGEEGSRVLLEEPAQLFQLVALGGGEGI